MEDLEALNRIRQMPDRVICDICGDSIDPHAHYIVRIEVFADPTLPPINTEDTEEADLQDTMQKLIDQMNEMTADDLQDQVHRSFVYRLCSPCQARFLINPLGKPRQTKAGTN